MNKVRSAAAKKWWDEHPEARVQRSAQAKRQWTTEFKAQMSAGAKRRCANPKVRKQRSNVMKRRWAVPGAKEQQSALAKARWKDPEYAERVTGSMKKTKSSPEARMRASEASKRAATPQVRAKRSDSLKLKWDQDPEWAAQRRAESAERWRDPKFKAEFSAVLRKSNSNPETRRRRSESQKKVAARPEIKREKRARQTALWKTPEFRARVEKGRLKAALAIIARNKPGRGRPPKDVIDQALHLYIPVKFGPRRIAERLDPDFTRLQEESRQIARLLRERGLTRAKRESLTVRHGDVKEALDAIEDRFRKAIDLRLEVLSEDAEKMFLPSKRTA